MKNLLQVLLIAVSLNLFSSAAQAVVVMQPLATFGTNGDGTVRPGDLFFLSSSNQWQRGMAYNPTTGHLLVVDRSTNTLTSGNGDVYILDGNTGAHLGKLDISAIFDGGNPAFKMNLIGIADDGAIYVGNLAQTNIPPQFRLYRWASETSPQTLVYPTEPFPNADPSNGNTNINQRRWGDTMAVRGSGLSTEILIGNRGNLAALFTPDDNTFAHFTPKTLATDAAIGGLSVGLSFGGGDTFWTTSGGFGNGPLLLMDYNTNAGTASTSSSFPSPDFPGAVSPILVIPSSNLFVGITMVPGPDVVRLYNIPNADEEPPIQLLDRKSFPTNRSNGNFSGALALGTNGVLYALDSDNGIMAFTFTNVASNPLPVAISQSPNAQTAYQGTNVTFVVGADGDAPISYQWYFGASLIPGATANSVVVTNVQFTNAGGYSVVVSNPLNVVTSSVANLTVLEVLPGTLLVRDHFGYAVGSALATDPATGQGPWLGVTTNQVAIVAAGNLDVSGLEASISNQVTWAAGGSLSMRAVISSETLTGSVYFSFAYKLDASSTVPAAAANGGAVAGLGDNGGSTYQYKVIVQTNTTGPGYNVGAYKRGGVLYGAVATNVIALGDTVFIVGRYTVNGAETTPATEFDNTIALWVNPPPATFGAVSAPTPSVGDGGIVALVGSPTADDPPNTRFHFRHAAGPSKSYADEVRVGRTWADVTPPAAVVTTPPTLFVTRSNSTAVISWPTNATGFNLQGATNLNSPINWANVTNSVVVSGTNNTVAVVATSGNQFFRLRK